MRDYSKISPQFWIGSTGKKLRTKGIECQLVSLYLMTCTHANMLGMYYLPKIYIAHECGLSIEGASKGLQGAIEAGFCAYDDDSEMVWVYEMATYQVGEQLKAEDKRVLGIQNEYNNLPECPHLLDFYKKYKDQFHMNEARGIQAPSKPLGSQEQEQEQEQKAGTGISLPAEKTAELPKPKNELAGKTWAAYSEAYLQKYKTKPVRNQVVSSQIVNFCKRIGAESPEVAAFYLNLQDQYYVRELHSVGALLKDAEKLRTKWATGMTQAPAQYQTKAERIAANNAKAGEDWLNGSSGENVIEGEVVHD